jgi:hypothetical protein
MQKKDAANTIAFMIVLTALVLVPLYGLYSLYGILANR